MTGVIPAHLRRRALARVRKDLATKHYDKWLRRDLQTAWPASVGGQVLNWLALP